jgi:hypothetical protein
VYVQHCTVQCTYCIRRVSAGPGVEGALRVNDTSNLGGGGGGEPSRPGAAWLIAAGLRLPFYLDWVELPLASLFP